MFNIFSKKNISEEKKQRIFFALHVPHEVGLCLLSSIPTNLPVVLYPKENFHITIKFVGEVNDEELVRIKEIAGRLASEMSPFEVTIKDFCIEEERLRATIEPSTALSRLFNGLTDELEALHLGKPQPKHYHPHITIGRPSAAFDPSNFAPDPSCARFSVQELELHQSEPGDDQLGKYTLAASFPLRGGVAHAERYHTIVLPTRAQPDTLVAIFLLKKFGESRFPGIKEAEIDFWQVVPAGETEETLDRQGIILLDLGGGRFDHHGARVKTTASHLVAEYLGVRENAALVKLLTYAERDDFFGKGTISDDPLDRAFGLSALIAALNKSLVKNPGKVVKIVMPMLIAHYNEEVRRTQDLPKEFAEKLQKGEAETFAVKQRGKKLNVVMVTSESGSLAGYLRSQQGGRFDVVAQWLPSGHLNILTRPTKRVDLRSLAALIRVEETTHAGRELEMNVREFSKFGRIKEVPEWYYDPATNSIQNGGLNPKEIPPTKIPKADLKKILELGLAEQMWDPRQ